MLAFIYVLMLLPLVQNHSYKMNTENLKISQKNSLNKNSYWNILSKSLQAGVVGASSMALHVLCLMWMRTTMNYQYKYGGGFISTVSTLFHHADVFRLYRGIIPALMIGPLYRFGDVAANMLAVNASRQSTELSKLPLFVQTSFGSVVAGLWRTLVLPINTWKTSKQVHGKQGLKILFGKTKTYGISSFYQGGAAQLLSTSLTHYSWFVVHNYLEAWLPRYSYKTQFSNAVIRSAVIGLLSTIAADCLVNSLRVVKTFKQTAIQRLSYGQVFSQIIKNDGVSGIFFRGLFTKILINSIQGVSFSVSWKYMEHRLADYKQVKN